MGDEPMTLVVVVEGDYPLRIPQIRPGRLTGAARSGIGTARRRATVEKVPVVAVEPHADVAGEAKLD